MSKPDGYPLPWCDELDVPYFRLNLHLMGLSGWRDFQRGRPMSAIIPVLRWFLFGAVPHE